MAAHLTEALIAFQEIACSELVIVVNDRVDLTGVHYDRLYQIGHHARSILIVISVFEAVYLLLKERPDVVVSTGVSPAVPFAFVCKLLRIPVVFVERLTRIHRPSLTALLMYRLADVFYVQWPELLEWFPFARYRGSLLDHDA